MEIPVETTEEKEALDRISDSVGKSIKKADTFGANNDAPN